MNADDVRALVRAKFPGVLDGPLATACATFAAADEADRAVEFASLQARATIADRLFVGVRPCGITYCDRSRERNGDYLRVAFLPYSTLRLEVQADCPPELRPGIERHAAGLQARRGEPFAIDACGHTVTLGSAL